MVITLNGENSFGLQHELQQLVAEFSKVNDDLALERLDGQEASCARIAESLTSLPFLSPQKMIILRAPGTNKEFAEKFEQLIERIPDTTSVIIVEPKLDKRLTYYKFLKKNTDFREFHELDINGLSRWLSAAAQAQNGSISSTDARYLVERVGASQQLLSNELEKLLLHNPKISRAAIDEMTESTPQSTIFQLLEAAFAGKTKQTLALYSEQRALKVEPQQIIAMLAWQLHVLAVIKTAEDRGADQIAKDARLNPFVVRKSQGIARNISLAELKDQVTQLLRIDTRSKRTNLDLDEALQHYLLKLAVN